MRAFVDSDAFASVWAAALRESHTLFVAVMQNDTSKVVQVSNGGEIGNQLAPIIALAITMALILAGLATGSIFFISALSPAVLPPTLAAILFGSVTVDIQARAAAVLTIVIVLAIVAWLAGPFATPRRLRAFCSSGADSIREPAEARGLVTGAVGEWMYAQRVLLRVAIAVVAAAIVLFSRPLSPTSTVVVASTDSAEPYPSVMPWFSMKGTGSVTVPFTITSKWRWQPVELPDVPMREMLVPTPTESPVETRIPSGAM